MQNFRGEPRWLEGTVTEQTVPVSCKVLVEDQLWKRRVAQMHKKHAYFMHRTADLSVTVSSHAVNQDNVDVEPTTHPRTEPLHENQPKLKAAKTAAMRQHKRLHQRNLKQNMIFRISVGECSVYYHFRMNSLVIR